MCLTDQGWDDRRRAKLNCSRDDLPPVPWQADAHSYTAWMGLPERAQGDGRDWKHPHEPLSEGCPGGWYRGKFIRSLDRYVPRIMGETWFESRHLNDRTPRLILQAVTAFMDWRQACENNAAKTRLRVLQHG